MASKGWSDRSGDERKSTFTRFLVLYGVITLVAVAFGWWLIAVVFGLIAVALLIATLVTDGGTPASEPIAERETPEWMKGIERPDLDPQPLPPPTRHDSPFSMPPQDPPADQP